MQMNSGHRCRGAKKGKRIHKVCCSKECGGREVRTALLDVDGGTARAGG